MIRLAEPMMTNSNNDSIFSCTLSPRYTDLDNWRHVNNSRLYQLHQEARMRAHLHHFGENAWFSDDIRLRPLRTNTQFLQETFYGEDIQAWVKVVNADSAHFHMHSELYQGGRLVGTQDALMAATQQGQRMALPDETLQQLSTLASGESIELPEASYLEQLDHAHNFPVRQQLTARFSDIDADSQRSEAALGRYMEQARFGGIRQLDFEGLRVMVAAVDISFTDFHMSWTPVELASGISHIGNSSFHFTGCALHKDEVQAAARSVMVVINPETGRPANIPPGLREQLEGWLI